MKYTIFGFSQKRLLELGLSADDALILDWFVTFQGSGRMRSMTVDGQAWYWVNYAGVLEDIPIAGGSEKTISRRFAKLKSAGVLEHMTIREGGTFSCFRLSEKTYLSLVNDVKNYSSEQWTDLSDRRTEVSSTPIENRQTDLSDRETELSEGRTEMGDGVGQNCPRGSDKSVRPKDSLTKRTLLPEELTRPPLPPTREPVTENSKRFTKPTVEQIADYCSERNNGINAQEFFDHYESKGWKVGRSPMKDWKAAVHTWEHARSKKSHNPRGRYHSEGNTPAPLTGWKKLGGIA